MQRPGSKQDHASRTQGVDLNADSEIRSAGPLDGVRVLDLTTILLGPFATQILGDMGADVVKVESPGGDATRDVGPPPADGMGAVFLGTNRNKRSIVLDLKQDVARKTLLHLATEADVFVHNMRPRAIARLGLRYQDLAGDPRYQFLDNRLANIDALYADVSKLLAARTSAEWLEACDAANIPAMPVHDPDELPENAHLAAENFW